MPLTLFYFPALVVPIGKNKAIRGCDICHMVETLYDISLCFMIAFFSKHLLEIFYVTDIMKTFSALTHNSKKDLRKLVVVFSSLINGEMEAQRGSSLPEIT